MRERPKPTLPTFPSMTTNRPSRRRNSAELDAWTTAKSGSRHIPKAARRATPSIISRSAAQPRVSNSGRTRAKPAASSASAVETLDPAAEFGQVEVRDYPAPPIGCGGQDDEVRFPAEQAPAQENSRYVGDFGRPAIGVGRVQAAEPHGPAVAERNIKALIDADRQDPPAGAAASRKARRRHDHDRQRDACDKKPQVAGARGRGAAAVRGAAIHAKGLAARRLPLSRAFWRLRR